MAALPSFYAENCTTEELSDGKDQKILIVDRQSGSTIAELNPLNGSYFERKLDETSIAEIIGIVTDTDCCEEFNDIFLGQEVEWYRDFNDDGTRTLAWAGVITFVRWSFDGILIQARDFTQWWDHRLTPSLDLDLDATDIVKALHVAAMEPDPITSFQLLTKQTGETIEFESYALEYKPIKEFIDELADYVIDYTAYGRNVLVGPAEFFPELPYFLTDSDFKNPPTIEARGPQYGFATQVTVIGANSVATATATGETLRSYGLIDYSLSLDHIKSQDDLEKAAASYLAIHSNPYYLNVGDGSPALKPGAGIPFRALIPGIRILVQTTSSCKKLRLRMRLLAVKADASGDVQITLEPIGETAEFEATIN